MSIHFKDLQEVLNILRDVKAYMYMMSKNDVLGAHILNRIDRILEDNVDKDLDDDLN